MEPNKEANKLRINYRYYEQPEGELVQGDKRPYIECECLSWVSAQYYFQL